MTQTYSQFGEDAFLLNHFAGRIGHLLDIGANDGLTFSNSRALIQAGWSATLVEPDPRAFTKLLDLYPPLQDSPPKVQLIHALVSPCFVASRNHFIPFHLSSETLTSTTQTAHRDKWASHFTFQPILTPPIRVQDIFDHPPHINPLFISIDTEGESVALLADLLRNCPQAAEVICIEWADDPAHTRALATQHGYAISFHNGTNAILVRHP